MSFMRNFAAGTAAAALMSALAVPAIAQQITTEIRGVVTDAQGTVLSGADVTVRDTRTGETRSSTSGGNGGFNTRGLSVGGPFTITVEADGYQTTTVEDVFANLGSQTQIVVPLTATADATTETIVVTGSALNLAQVAAGPSATFGLNDLQNAPSFNRDIRDTIRQDPRIFVNEGFVNAIRCNGANPRFNGFTVDGVRFADRFGLNSTNNPGERTSFPFDAIEQVNVEFSPISVEYGGFTSCNVNAVTKSGTNEFSGTAFFDYTDDNLRGNSIEGREVNVPEFDEIRYGFSLGGPIIKDRLFFFGAYERFEGQNIFERGPIGSGAANEVPGLTQDVFDRIVTASNDLYQYNPGGNPSSIDNFDEKYIVKLTWLITDDHKLDATYYFNDGNNWTQSDGDADEFEFEKHLYERGAETKSYRGALFSDWTDNLSTELRVAYTEVDNRQECIDGGVFGEIQIDIGPSTVYLGCDDSRQSNDLNYDSLQFVAKAFYTVGNHYLTFGYERDTLDIFNLFVQHTETEIRFDSLEAFEAGLADDRIVYAGSPSGNVNNAAAEWGYTVNTIYAQNEYSIPQYGLTLIGGLRYDWYQSDDLPTENPAFTEDYGFSNSQNLDGEGLLQPRLGAIWEATEDLTIQVGAGRYSGGNPNVWLSNNYSSNNITQVTVDSRARDQEGGVFDLFNLEYGACESGAPVGPGYCIPQFQLDAVAAGQGSNFEINVLDPDFEIPAEWKFNVGATYLLDVPYDILGGVYELRADVIYSFSNNAANVVRGDLQQVDSALGGLPIFESPQIDSFILDNSGETESISVAASIYKEYDFGLNWFLGYAFTDAEDTNPMTSSVAFSNYNNRSFVNPNDAGLATSNYETRHRITMTVNYEKDFIRDYFTKFTLFGEVFSGEPFSYTFNDSNDFFNFTPFLGGDQLQLYVPRGPNDENVVFADGFDTDAFFKFVNDNDLDEFKGGYADRNAFRGDWITKFDLRIAQEFPGLFPEHRTEAFVIIENVGNLINDEWGIYRQPDFPGNVGIVNGELLDDGRLQYNQFTGTDGETSVDGSVSLWNIRIGVKYDF